MKRNEKTKIQFELDGKEYCLEYTLASVKKMEKDGLDLKNFESQLITSMDILIKGLFIAHHDKLSDEERLDIYSQLKGEVDDNQLMEVIVTMFQEVVEEINNSKGNVKWRVVKN